MADEYICEVKHAPGFIKAEDDRAKFGQHCLELLFICRNSRGAVVLQLMTGWYPFDGIIGSQRHYNVRMAWHLPVPTNPLDIPEYQTPHNCDIINQKCIGSSHYDHDGLWMKMLCYSTSEHFWDAMKKFHASITQPGPWNPFDAKTELVPNRLYLPMNTESFP